MANYVLEASVTGREAWKSHSSTEHRKVPGVSEKEEEGRPESFID